MNTLYKGSELTIPITLTNDGEPVAFADVSVSVDLYIKGRLVGAYSKAAETVTETDTANICEIHLTAEETGKYPIGELRAKITVGFADTNYPDDVRHETVVVPGYLVKEAR